MAFDPVQDYHDYVDGKPRADGTRSFLASRGITLPEGDLSDPPSAPTVQGLGNHKKNEIMLCRIRQGRLQAYARSRRSVEADRALGLRRGVVSSSTNCRDAPIAAEIKHLFEQRADELAAERDHLAGKPAPARLLATARALGVSPAESALFEEALAGVAVKRNGGFGFVVGVHRAGQADQLTAHGADVVVAGFAELLDRP
ncbi:HAD family hydrolase [Nonomuraea sp. NPDC026600]|uniref:HAD family hydrolase n=1 Tax=Nonomuraea sp. NPDC026600 TaxID=3155363 RepID=UPI0033E1819A